MKTPSPAETEQPQPERPMIERRVLSVDEQPIEVEERSAGSPKVRGLAAVYNSQSRDLGGFREIIAPGAFDHLLAKKSIDVVALWNHEQGSLLGRTTSGTLRLWSDNKGLRYEVDLPNTTLARDLMTLIARRDIVGSSFAFTVTADDEEIERDEESGAVTRTIRKINSLHDVSLVSTPAYEATSVSIRSVKSFIANEESARIAAKLATEQRIRSAEVSRIIALTLTE